MMTVNPQRIRTAEARYAMALDRVFFRLVLIVSIAGIMQVLGENLLGH